MDPFELWDLGYAANNGFGPMDITGISPDYYDIMNMPVGGDYGWSPEMDTWGLGYQGDNGAGTMDISGGEPWGWGDFNPVAGWNMSNMPWGALALGGATLGSQYLGSRQAASQAEANWNKQFETWKQFAFPSQDAVNAATDAGKKTINQAMPGAMSQLDEKLAGRGFSPGSGAIAKGYTDLEKQRVQDMGQLASKMAIMQNTPMFSPMGYPNTTSFGENLANTIGGLTGILGGMSAYDWLKNRV